MIKNKKMLYEMLSCKALKKNQCCRICFAVQGSLIFGVIVSIPTGDRTNFSSQKQLSFLI